MALGIRHARSIYAAETLVRVTFNDVLLSGEGWREKIVSLQREFAIILRLTTQRFESLKIDLGNWQQQVRCGDVDFASEREDDFKGGLRAFIDLASLLSDKFDAFHKRNLYLVKPRRIGVLDAQRKEAEKILDTWRPPEWEVTNERTVNWDKEQTGYLRAKLDSCK
jgi:hypothetical protein